MVSKQQKFADAVVDQVLDVLAAAPSTGRHCNQAALQLPKPGSGKSWVAIRMTAPECL